MASPAGITIDQTTILSLLSTVLILGAAYGTSVALLPKTTPNKTRALFIWHAFDSLIHSCLEGGYLYNCFFSYTTTNTISTLWSSGSTRPTSAYLPPDIYFLNHPDRLYGALYSTNPLAALWREYARADARWAGTDLTIISLELLTVCLGAPCAAWICYCIYRSRKEAWFWMVVLATGELYGGFMTFAPEWLSGSGNLVGKGDGMLLWVYLVFFNMLWVFIPGWVIYEGYVNLVSGGSRGGAEGGGPASAVGKRGAGKKKK